MSDTTASLDWTEKTRGPRLYVRTHGWLLVAGWMALVAISVNFLLVTWVSSGPINMYVVQPLLWGSVGALALWSMQSDCLRPRDPWLIGGAILVGLFQAVLLWLAGSLAGFGNSPYSHEPVFVVLNLWFVATRLVGLELARSLLMKTLGRRNMFLGGVLVWFLLTAASLPLRSFTNLIGTDHTMDFLGGIVVPVAGQNILATYLVVVGGPLASIAYLGTLQFFEWIPSVLPNLPWIFTLFVGIVAPTIGLMVARDIKQWRTPAAQETKREDTENSGNSTLWVIVGAVVVFLIWFNTGAFGVRPALIAGQSMQPAMWLGDVAITRQVPLAEIQVGDVIRFQQGSMSVVHRVKAIHNKDGQTVFLTRGDNNDADDPPVPASRIEGKLVTFIPKVGWISIWVKSLFGMVR